MRIGWRPVVAILLLAAALSVTLGLTVGARSQASSLSHADVAEACGDNQAMSALISEGRATIESRHAAGIAFATSKSKYFVCFASEDATGAITDVYVRPLSSLKAPLRVMALWSVWRPVGTFLVIHEGPAVSSIIVTVRSSSVRVWPVGHGFSIVSIVGTYVPSLADFSSPTETGQAFVGTVVGLDRARHEVAALPILVCRGDPVAMGNGCPHESR